MEQQLWDMVTGLAKEVVESEFDRLPGNTPKEKEDAGVAWVLERVESVDHLIPVIGKYMDLPIVDTVERIVIDRIAREGIRLVIRQQYAAMKIEQATAA